jgi:hypothetical protein
MQRQTATDQRDALGQDTGRSEGHLSNCLLGGAPGCELFVLCGNAMSRSS